MTPKRTTGYTNKDVLNLLSRENRPMSLRDMIRALGVPAEARPTFRKRVRALAEEGDLIRVRSRFAVPESLSIFKGRFRGHREGFGFVLVEGDEGGQAKEGDILIKRTRVRGAMDGDLVAAQVEKTHPDGRREGSIVEILERAHETLVGRLVVERRRAWVEPQEKRIPWPFLITPSKRGSAQPGEWVEVAIERYPSQKEDARGVILRSFGYPDDPAVEQEMIIAKWGIREEFPRDVLQEVATHHPPAEDEPFPKGVIDLRDLETFTIDPRTARDHDDAISIELLPDGIRRLGVHIADVSHYVQGGSPTDREAALRGNSVYFPDRAIPMLPPELSGDICSLRAGEVRRTLSAFLDFDSDGNRVDFRVMIARIRSCAQLTYHGAGAVLEGRTIPEVEEYDLALQFREPLERLAELAAQLREKRMIGGSLDFDLPEAFVMLDQKGDPMAIERSPRNTAHRLVEECMLAANRAVAEMLQKEVGPAVYRNHEPPDEESLEKVRFAVARLGITAPRVDELMRGKGLQEILDAAEGKDIEKYVNLLVLRSMKLARYEHAPAVHFGLGFEAYTHFTSPIRRYADLLVHRNLKRLMRGDRRKPDINQLAAVCLHVSEQERKAESAEREMIDFHKALFMKDKIGERFTGHVSGATSFGLFVELEEIFVEGMVPLESMTDDWYNYLPDEHSLLGERAGRRLRLGDPATVRVVSVDLARREITFQLLSGGSREVPAGAETRVRRRPGARGLKRPQRADEYSPKFKTGRKKPTRQLKPSKRRGKSR